MINQSSFAEITVSLLTTTATTHAVQIVKKSVYIYTPEASTAHAYNAREN